MSKFLQLPNGTMYEVPDSATYAEAWAAAQKDVPKAFGLEKKGVGAALGQGLESLLSSGQTAYEALTSDAEKAAKKGLSRQEQIGGKYADQIGLDLLKKKYEEEGVLAAGKELARQVPLAIAEQAPNIGATLAAGRIGAMAGAPLGPVGAVVGGLGGAALPSLVQQFGGNIERQQKEGAPIDVGAAGAAAVPQAALDVAGTFVPFGRTLIGKALGPSVAKALEKGASGAAEKLAQESLKKSVAKGLGVGAIAEIPTEIAQQMLERQQAGLSLTSEDALSEYGDTAYQVGLLAPIGAAGRVVDRSGARKDAAAKQAAEEETKAQAAETARLASPAHYDFLVGEQERIQEQIANIEYGLTRAKKPEKLQAKLETANGQLTEVQAKLAAHPMAQKAAEQAQAGQLEQLQAQETGAEADMVQQQLAQRAADEEQRKQASLAQGLGQQLAVPGAQPVTGPEMPAFNPEQRAAAEQQVGTIQSQLQNVQNEITRREKDIAAAAAKGDTATVTKLMQPGENGAVTLDTLRQYQTQMATALKDAEKAAAELRKADPSEHLKTLTKQLTKAGEEGNFAAIQALAPQIEQLKAQVGELAPAAPAQTQFQMFGEEGQPTKMAERATKQAEKVAAEEEKAAVAQTQEDLFAQQAQPELNTAEGYQASLQQLEEEYAKTADERTVGRLVDLLSKGGAKEEDTAGIADTSLQPQQHKFRASEAKGDVDEAFMRFSEALTDVKDGTYLGGKNTAGASSSKAGLLKKADQAKRDYIEAVLQQVDNDRLARRHNSLTQGQALQLAMQIHTAMDRNLKAGTVEPQLEQHLKQYATPFYKPTTQKAFGLTMQTEKSLAKKVAREEAGIEKELTAEEKAVQREAMRTEEGGKGVQKTLPGIEPIATERATPANFMKFLNSAEVAKLRRTVDAEKARDAEIGRLIKASIRKDQAKYEAMVTKVEVETGKFREAIGDITELERKDAIYAAEQKLNEAIKKAEQDYMQGMEVLGPVINQAQRELARVEPNVTVAADRAVASKLRDWLNQAYDLRDKYAGRVEALRNSRVEIDEHKVRRDAILSDYIQNRKKALDKLEAEVKNKPLGPVARKANEQRAKIAVAEKALKDRNEAQDKLRRDREQAALEFDKRSKEYGQKVETAMAWDPNIGEFVEAKGKKGEILKRKVVSTRAASAETKAEEVRKAQKEMAKERAESRKENLRKKAEGEAITAEEIAAELDRIAKALKDKNVHAVEKKVLAKKQKKLQESAKLLKAGRQLVRIAEAPAPKRGELMTARKERTEAKKAAEIPEIEEDLAYNDREFARSTLLRKAETPVSGKIDLKAARVLADKVKAKLAKSGIKLEYYDSVDTADARAKSVYNYHGVNGTTGFIYPDGTVVVFGDAHKDMRDLEETIAHEVIGHYGVEGMLGAKGISDLTDKLFETDGLVYRVAEALGVWDVVRVTEEHAKRTNLPLQKQRMLMVQELIAHVAEERGIPKGMVETAKRWIKLVVNAIRNAFARNDLDDLTKATTREIQQLIDKAERNYIENRMPAYANAKSGEVKFRTKVEYAPSYNPELQRIADQVLAKNQTLKDKVKANATGLNFAIQFTDRFAGLEAVAKQMKDQLAAFQMMYWNRTYDARNMVVAETATNGPRKIVTQKRADGNTEKVIEASGAPGLKDIAAEVGKSAKRIGNSNAALQQFSLYMVARRAKRVGIDVAFGNNSSMTMQQVDDILKAGDADVHFKKAADMYGQYNKALMEFLAQSGAISKQQAAELTKYNDYVGFYREKNGVIVDGEHNITIGDLTHNKFLKELLGSDQAIVDFATSSLQNTSLITDIALRNIATKNNAYTLEKLGLAKILKGKGPATGNVVRFKEHGEDKYAVIDDAMGVPADLLVKGMEGISTSLPAAIRFMQGPANLLRKGVTRMPLYAVRQVIRDSMSAVMTGGVDAMPVTSSLKQLGSMIGGKNEVEAKLQAKGLLGGQVFSATPDDMKLILQDIAAGKDHWTTLMSKLDHLAMKSDASSRVTAYNSFIKQGMSDMEASLAALEMMNFTKRGVSPSVNALSTMIPFFNAQIQGLNVLVKAFRGTSLFEKKLDIQSKLLKRGAMMMGMTLLYAAMMSDDEAYKNATPEEKYNNWFVYIPGFDEPIRVPIPFELGYAFKALPEALYNLAMTDEKAATTLKAFQQMAINTIPGASNMFMPQALKPAVEAVANYSFFSGNPIESGRVTGLERGKRATENTTEVAKMLGDMTSVSPIKIDYLIRGYTGGLGAAITALLNPVLASPEKPGTPDKKMSQMAFIGQAFQPTDGRGIINEAYDTMDKAIKAKRTINDLLERGETTEAKAYATENANLIAIGSAAGKYRQRMGEFTKQQRLIATDQTMTPAEKRKAIDEIQQAKIALAKELRSAE